MKIFGGRKMDGRANKAGQPSWLTGSGKSTDMENDIPPALPPKAKWSALASSRQAELQSESVCDSLSTDSLQDIPLKSENKEKVDDKCKSVPIPAPRRSRSKALSYHKEVSLAEATVQDDKHNISNISNPVYYSSTRIQENGSCENSPKDYDIQSSSTSFNDTDSIHFLEQHKPNLTKSSSMKDKWKWWNDSANKISLLEKRKHRSSDTSVYLGDDHIYETYEYQQNSSRNCSHSYEEVLELPQQKRDIFDSVSFKSPLYGTWFKPSFDVSKECKSSVEAGDQPLESRLLDASVQNTNYDIPTLLNTDEKNLDFQDASEEFTTIYDMPIPEIPPPSHPPPPLPADVLVEVSDGSPSSPPLPPPRSPPPNLPPRPSLIPAVSAINEVAQIVPMRNHSNFTSKSSEGSTNSSLNKPLMPVRPAPPVPRNSSTSDLPPPLPGKVSSLGRILKQCSRTSKRNHNEERHNCSPTCSTPQSISSASTSCASDSKERSKLFHSGYLFKTGSNLKEFLQRWCVLDSKRFSYYLNEKESSFRDSIDVKDMVSLSICAQDKHSCTNCQLELCCFELSTVKEEGRQFLFGARLPSDRQEWMKFLYLAMALPPYRLKEWSLEFTHAGYLHLKEGAAGHWQLAWVVLKKRNLLVCQLELKTTETVDLRKSIGVAKFAPNSVQGSATASCVNGPIFHIDLPQKSLYLHADWPAHTESWYQAIHRAWVLPADPQLKDHYLTQENVPVIIDKCVNFVSTYGTTVQGVYRLAGSSSKVKKLLELLRQNVWTVHIKPDEYCVHDVTTVLKRFLRELPECIVTEKLYQLWARASEIDNQEERLVTYKDLLHQLPEENYQGLKKLVGHLFSISEHEDKNMMPSMNLAPIFGPTMLFTMSNELHGYNQTNAVMDVVADLITHYAWLFQVDPKEMEKEKKIQQALQLLREARVAQRPAGDILVGVYVYSREWGKCLNVRLTPTMTAEDLCLYAFSHADIKESCEKLAVFEIICNEELERPLHYQEVVLAVTLRWASWAEADAKGNYLLVKHNYICDAIMPLIQTRQPLSMFSELRFADSHSKTFKKMLFEFIGAKLTCYKDAKASGPLGQWNVEDITWYIGIEMKRSAPTRWGFTFVEQNKPFKRTKENPYFGRAVCCNNEEEFHKWLAAMLIGEHPTSLLPQRQVPDLLS